MLPPSPATALVAAAAKIFYLCKSIFLFSFYFLSVFVSIKMLNMPTSSAGITTNSSAARYQYCHSSCFFALAEMLLLLMVLLMLLMMLLLPVVAADLCSFYNLFSLNICLSVCPSVWCSTGIK